MSWITKKLDVNIIVVHAIKILAGTFIENMVFAGTKSISGGLTVYILKVARALTLLVFYLKNLFEYLFCKQFHLIIPENNLKLVNLQTFSWLSQFKKTFNSLPKTKFQIVYDLNMKFCRYTERCHQHGKYPLLPSSKKKTEIKKN